MAPRPYWSFAARVLRTHSPHGEDNGQAFPVVRSFACPACGHALRDGDFIQKKGGGLTCHYCQPFHAAVWQGTHDILSNRLPNCPACTIESARIEDRACVRCHGTGLEPDGG